ncbi:MAG: 50S ribosomal protein L10 [Candidatus Hodgkinia cicadicola]
MSVRSTFGQTKFNKTDCLVKTNKTFLLLTFENIETNSFAKLRKVLSNFTAKLHFAKTNHINLALNDLFPKVVLPIKGQCLLIIIPSFEFEVLKRLSSFAKANGLTVLVAVCDGLLQPIVDLRDLAKFKTFNSVKLALLTCLRSPLNRVLQSLRTPFNELILSFPRKLD